MSQILFVDTRPAENCYYRVYEKYKHLLMLRSDYPLSPIYSTKNLAKKISRDQERRDKVNLVGEKKDTIILGRIVIKLDGFGELYRKLLEESKEMQEDLFGGISFEDEDWFGFTEPLTLVDEVNETCAGFWFGELEMNDLKKYEDRGLKVLFHHPCMKDRYGCMLSEEKFIPNAYAIHEFLYRSSLARSKLTTAIHISVGGPARGTELSSNYLRNHPQGDIRNIKIVDGDLCLVGTHNKSTNMVCVSVTSVTIQRSDTVE